MADSIIYICPVCFSEMEDSPEYGLYNICTVCMTEFGNDDEILTHEELRHIWLERVNDIRI